MQQCRICGAPRYLPYSLCHDCLLEEREREARNLERQSFLVEHKPAPEHGQYTNSDGKAEWKDAT